MYKIGLALAIAVVSGCSGESPEADDRAQQVAADTASATGPVNPHARHAIEDTASGAANATDAMAGMDHESAALAGSAAHVGHAGMQGGAPGATDGQRSGVAGGGVAASAGGIDHSRHTAAAGSRTETGSQPGVDHSQLAAAISSQGGQSPAESHASMGHPQPAATSGGGLAPADHSQHAQVAAGAGQSRTSGADHSQHLTGSPQPDVAPAIAGAAAGMDKLVALVAVLVQDSVVQRTIEQDPILRGHWDNPGVRRIILPRQ